MPAPLFAPFAEGWLAAQQMRLADSTHAGYAGIVRRYLTPTLGHTPLDDIRTADVNRLYGQLLEGGGSAGQPLSSRTVRYTHCVLSRCMDSAALQDIIGRNPCWGAAVPGRYFQGRAVYPTVWSSRQAARFLATIDDQAHPLAMLFRLAIATGMRRGELVGLRWEDVQRNGTIRVRWTATNGRRGLALHRPKGRRPRALRIDAATGDLLERHRLWEALKPRDPAAPGSDWGLVFTNASGGVLHPDTVSRAFRRTVQRVPRLPLIRFHDLRHTHATMLLAAGVPLHVVSGRLGHTPQVTLMYYAHVLPPSDTAAAHAYAQAVDGRCSRDDDSWLETDDGRGWTEASGAFEARMPAWGRKAAWQSSTAPSLPPIRSRT